MNSPIEIVDLEDYIGYIGDIATSAQTLFADLLGFFDRNTAQHPYGSVLIGSDTGGNLP